MSLIHNLLLQASLLPGIGGEDGAATDAAASGMVGNLAELKSLSMHDLLNRLADSAVKFATNVALAIVVFYIGRFIIRKIYGVIAAVFLRRSIDRSLSTFVLSLVNIVLYFILIVTVIGILGIETTSFLAIFASAGVAIGMALSGTLQNFAGGVLILLLKPYKIGDYIEVQGYAGTVKEIQIFFTVITTPDNKSISIPNGGLSTGSVNNYSREAFRRVNWTVSISYGDDVNAAREAILDMFEADSRIMPLKVSEENPVVEVVDDEQAANDMAAPAAANSGRPSEANSQGWFSSLFGSKKRIAVADDELQKSASLAGPAIKALTPTPNHSPAVYVDSLAASSVDLTVRAWVKSGDYWAVYFYYNELFYNELPKHGIHFPFPQMDVHVTN